jgi:hypothetical protein
VDTVYFSVYWVIGKNRHCRRPTLAIIFKYRFRFVIIILELL